MPWRGLIFGAVVGFFIPAGVFLYLWLGGVTAGPGGALLWPSSLMLMATESMKPSEAVGVLVESIAINAVIYAVVGAVFELSDRARRELDQY